MKKITITKNDGGKLAAWLSIPSNARYLLIICHGFTGAKENRGKIFPFAAALNARGAGVLAFDFSGSGESSGDFSSVTLSSQADDLQWVIQYAEQEFGLSLILLGRSFGGSTIIAMPQQRESIKGYIFWSVPIDLKNTFRKVLGDLYDQLEAGKAVNMMNGDRPFTLQPDLVLEFQKIDLKQNLSALGNKPVLICHGKADEVVAFTDAVNMHQTLSQSSLALVDQADHRFTEFTELRVRITLKWLEDTFQLR